MKSIFTPVFILALLFTDLEVGVAQCLTFSAVAEDCDLTVNDPFFWNHSDWWDASIESHDMADAPVNLSLTVADTCSGATPAPFTCLLELDLDGDGQCETQFDSNAPMSGGWIFFNNSNGNSGVLRQYDFRPVAADLLYRFALRQQVLPDGSRRTALMWTDKTSPDPDYANDWTLPQLPYGNHRIRWFLAGQMVREAVFDLRDCKLPTVVCSQGLSANYMPTKSLTIWGSDFLQFAEDNFTPANQLVFSVRKAGAGTGFPIDNQGNPIPGVTFTCIGDGIGFKSIELWVKDKHGNLGVCQLDLIVQDPFLNCNGTPPSKGLCFVNAKNEGIEGIFVKFKDYHPTVPFPDSIYGMTDANGCIKIGGSFPLPASGVLTPFKDDNPLNGVTTYDLLLMSRHILGAAPLDSPYKIIAADVNKNGSVTTNDIVELRKLILGIYTDLPHNDSWRFVLKNYVFPNSLNPFAPAFPESIKLIDLTNQTVFVAMKTGDINGNASTNFANADDHAPHTFLIENQKLTTGEEYILPVSDGSSQHQISGFQIGLKIDPTAAVLQEILPAAAADFSAENFATSPDGSVSISWFDAASTARTSASEPLIFLKIKVLRDCRVSEILSLDNSRLLPEAYDSEVSIRKLDLQFFEKSGVREPFLLFPNPTSGEVFLEMKNLTQPAQFEIFDALGRSLRRGELVEPRTRLDVSEFLAGQFFVKIFSGGSVSSLIFFKK